MAKAAAPWFDIPVRPAESDRRAVVIGAGLAGTALASALAGRGWDITLIERHAGPAGEASGNPAGVLMPIMAVGCDPRRRWFEAGFRYTLQLLAELDDAVEWSPCGVLLVAWNARERRRQETLLERQPSQAFYWRPVDAPTATKLCGLPIDRQGLYLADGGWVQPPSLCRAQLSGACVRVLYRCEVASLRRQNGEWGVLDSRGQELARAPVVAIATGKDAARFQQTRGLPLTMVRGQITELDATPASAALKAVVCGAGFAIPARNGKHTIGATHDPDDANPAVTDSSHDLNRGTLRQYLPALADELSDSSAAGRVAFRAASPDYLPLVGPVPIENMYREVYADLQRGRAPSCYPLAPCYPGLYLSAGHGSRGLASAPLAGEVLAAIIEGESNPLPKDLLFALHPARFWVRELRKPAANIRIA